MEDFLSHSTEKPRRGTLLSFRSIPERKELWIRKLGGVDYHELPSEMFCLTVPKKIVQESFSVSFNFGYRKNLGIRGVGHEVL